MARADKVWDKRGKDGRYDVIIIGSGMGGMTAAALLTRLGKRVLVLEQHYVAGGFTHMFNRPGYTWDVGVHAVGEVTEHSVTGRILADLSSGQLEWSSLGPVYDEFYFPDDTRIDFPDRLPQFRENLLEAFPRERAAVDGYLDMVREVSSGMRPYYLARVLPARIGPLAERLIARRAHRYFDMRTEDVMGRLTQDDKLKTVLTAQWGYYGSLPANSSFAIQALVAKHFAYGGYYPVGGAGEIARTLLKTVADGGGWTRISTDVDQIIIEKGRAVGVRLKKTGEELRAPKVISAAGVMSTVQRLLPPEHQRASWAQSVKALTPAPAHVCLYIGFKGDIRGAGAGAANKWFYETWKRNIEGWDISKDAEADAPILYCSFPSLKDPTHDPGPEQRHTGEVVTFVPWELFEPWLGSRWKKRGGDYDAFKKDLEQRILDQFLRHMPQLRSMIDVVELSTPLTTDHFTRPMKGSIYGIEPTPARFRNRWLRPRSPIPGLYFAGSEVVSVGVIGAMMGGILAALATEPIPAFRYLQKMGFIGRR